MKQAQAPTWEAGRTRSGAGPSPRSDDDLLEMVSGIGDSSQLARDRRSAPVHVRRRLEAAGVHQATGAGRYGSLVSRYAEFAILRGDRRTKPARGERSWRQDGAGLGVEKTIGPPYDPAGGRRGRLPKDGRSKGKLALGAGCGAEDEPLAMRRWCHRGWLPGRGLGRDPRRRRASGAGRGAWPSRSVVRLLAAIDSVAPEVRRCRPRGERCGGRCPRAGGRCWPRDVEDGT